MTQGRSLALSAMAPSIMVGVMAAKRQYQMEIKSAGTFGLERAGLSPRF